MLAFQIEYEDGSFAEVEVPMTFDDVPEEVLARVMRDHDRADVAGITAELLAWRLDVPYEAALRLVDELLVGEGVVVAQDG